VVEINFKTNKEDKMKKEFLDVVEYDGEGYMPMVDYQSWRCAVLRYCEELEVQNLDNMQKHDETD